MSIYQLIVEATDEDTAYYQARNSHRRRNDTIETQIYAAIGDATMQYRNGRHDLAAMIANIKATNGIEITLPHATALATFAELPLHFGKPPQSITWLSPYGKITIRDADHAS